MKKGLILSILSLTMILAACNSDDEDKIEIAESNKEVELTENEKIDKSKEIRKEFEKELKKNEDKVKVTEVNSNIPDSYNSALQEAQAYVDLMDFSRESLADQLTSAFGGKFTDKEAKYALENVSADYEKEALNLAINYRSDNSKMSDQELIDKLVLDYDTKFTSEEAHYAINNLPTNLVIPPPTFED